MSFNQQFYTNFHEHCTFQNGTPPNILIPPPPPPPYLLSSMSDNEDIHNTDIVKCFEETITNRHTHEKRFCKNVSIIEFQQYLQNALITLSEIKDLENYVSQNKEKLSEIEWKATMKEIYSKRDIVTVILSKISETNLDALKKLIAKRLSKRKRQRQLRAIKKQEKEIKIEESKEKSRCIDENLQTIRDSWSKMEQQKTSKQNADLVLKEVLSKKYDAKRWISKLDALVKLRKARLNTFRGKGVKVSEKEAELFNLNIENLKSLWVHKSAQYDEEEVDLRNQLQQKKNEFKDINEGIKNNLRDWKTVLFGDVVLPQSNFSGDIQKFISLRLQWDNYIDFEGSPLPVGWVTPRITPTD